MHYLWLFVIAIAVLYNWILIVARSCFDKLQTSDYFFWLVLDYLSDGTSPLYTPLNQILARDKHRVSGAGSAGEGLSKLRDRYIRMFQFKLDVVNPQLRFNRLLHFPRMFEFFDRTETCTNYPNIFHICNLVLYILVIIHWNACIYFAISKSLGFGSDTCVYPNISNPECCG
ncbi:unnamed protein product, partial [Coregonus sp. 'balchen']